MTLNDPISREDDSFQYKLGYVLGSSSAVI